MRGRLVSILLITYCALLHAAGYDESLFTGLHWRLIGPFRGGRVLGVTGVPGQPEHFYFGSVNGGVWESNDAGRTWNPIFDSMPIASIGAIAVAPSVPAVIYVGSGEADMRSDIGYGNGMYKSVDAGKTWKHIGLEDSHQIGRILVDPKNPNTLFVAVLGHAYGPNEERGVFRSHDGGVTWQKILYKDVNTGAVDLSFGADDSTIYAALWQTRRPPWNVYPPSKGPGSGLYKSTDGGNTWNQIKGNGFPEEQVGRIGIAVAPSNTSILYSLVDAAKGGLYRSEDAGAHWTYVSSDKRIWQRGWYFEGVAVDPKNADIVFACNTVLYKSTDGGKTFLPFRGAPGGDDYHSLWIDPADSNRMISGTDQGAIVTVNGGLTWSSWYNQPTAQFYHVSTDQRFPYRVYGTQQDSGAAAVPSRTSSPYDGINIMQFREIRAGDENGYIHPDPLNNEIIYGAGVEKSDSNTDQTANVDPTFAYPDLYRGEWTLPLTFSPLNPRALYYANQYLFQTMDGGKHWSKLSPDLTREKLVVPPNLDPITAEDSQAKGERRAVIYSITPSPLQEHLLWIGTDDGLVWLTQDEGTHWRNITPDVLTPWSKVAIIEASHFEAGAAYIVVDRHRIDDYKPYIYRTHDSGQSWVLITNGIPVGHFVNVVREDPQKKGLLYAGTELGIFVSFNDGENWQPLQLNLPTTSVRDINVHDSDLVIGTHGRSFWILDDVAPLRQINENILQSDAWLFKPGMAYRIQSSGFTGTPLPKDEPIAENPPSGAMLDYYIKDDSAQPVTLEILRAGERVQTFSSEDKPNRPDMSKVKVAPIWFPRQHILSAKRGMHRFVWNVHYPLPAVLMVPDSTDDQKGIWALPGDYTVKLTVNGRSYTQPLLIRNDPRVKELPANLERQFEFAKQIQSERVRIAVVTKEVEALLKRAEEARGKTSQRLSNKLQAFEKATIELTDLRETTPENGAPESYPSTTTSILFLGNSIKALQRSLDDTDDAPSPDSITGFEKLRPVLDSTIKRWEELKAKWLPDLNAALQRESLPPLSAH